MKNIRVSSGINSDFAIISFDMSKDQMAADWLQLYDMCNTTASDAQVEINEKDRLGKSGANTAKLQRSIRQKIDSIQGDIASLTKSLAEMERRPSDYRIGEGELNRRRGMLTQLKNNFERVQKAFSGDTPKRTALFGGDEERRQKVVEENERTRDLSNDQLMQEQKMMVQQQDRHLDDILVGVTRLKNIGEDINQELDVHSGLLNQLDKGVDNTTMNIRTQTKKAEAIQEESGGCLGLCIIFFLVGVILMLLMIPGP